MLFGGISGNRTPAPLPRPRQHSRHVQTVAVAGALFVFPTACDRDEHATPWPSGSVTPTVQGDVTIEPDVSPTRTPPQSPTPQASPSPISPTPPPSPTPTPIPGAPIVEITQPRSQDLYEGAEIGLEGTTTDSDTIGSLFWSLNDAEAVPIEFTPDTHVAFSATVLLAASGSQSLRVTAVDDQGLAGSSQVHFTSYEPNDVLEQAFPVELAFSSPELTLVNTNDDWYRFDLQERTFLVIDINAASEGSTLDTFLSLYDDSGTRIDYNNDDGTSYDSYLDRELEPGIYYVEVRDLFGATTDIYYLSIHEGIPPTDDSLEPNDRLEDASRIQLDYNNDTLILADDDFDFFTFSLIEQNLITVDVDAVDIASTIDPFARLYDASGTELISDDGPGGGDPYLTVDLSPGTYFLSLESRGSDNSDFYHLTVTSAPAIPDDELEQNDDATTATAITLPYQSSELILAYIDEDWFAIEIAEESYLAFDIDAQEYGSTLDTLIELYDEAGRLEGENDDETYSYDSHLEALIPAGRHFLRVKDVYGDKVDTYFLSVQEAAPPTNDELEPNNSFDLASTITLDYASPQLMILAGDLDYFSFEIPASGSLTIDINAKTIGSSLDSKIYLYNSDRNEVRRNDDDGSTLDSYLETQVRAGTYFLLVTSTASEGLYFLTIHFE